MNGRSNESAITRFGKALLHLSALPGKYGSILILILVLVVMVSVLGAQMGWSDIAVWDRRLPLLGNHLNMTSIAELQWHLFSLLIMLSGAYALKEDRHIRVDIVSSRLKPRTRIWIDILGDVFLLIPFFALLAWYSLAFTQMSFNFGEQSNAGGLVDRYLIKAVLPLGSVLLVIAGVGRVIRNIGLLLSDQFEHLDSTVDGKAETNDRGAAS